MTGVPSILELAWDASSRSLHGSSETIPGEDYTLFVHVPEGTTLSGAEASTAGSRDVPVRQDLAGRLLKVSFPGQPGTVAWRLEFAGGAY